MMNKSGPRIDPCGTPVLTGRRLDVDVVYLYELLSIRQVTILKI